MRLIDADKLVYEDITDENGNIYMVVHAPQIDNANTIEAVPVVHGTWKHGMSEHYYICSECSNIADFDFDFCPHCGANMKEKTI